MSIISSTRIKTALILLSAALGMGVARVEEPGYPKVFFHYSPYFDLSFCGPNVGELFAARETILKDPQGFLDTISSWQATKVQTDEASERLQEFQAAWDAMAPDLLGTVVSQIGGAFSRKEYTATLMLCRSKLSLGTSILLTYWPFLKTTAFGTPAPKTALGSLLFHELLHSYVNERIDPTKPTPLLTRFAQEPVLTRAHLHLMAIQKMVYLKLNQKDVLEARIRSDSFLPDYARAWAIVNLAEPGFQAFVDELKGR